jgi:hypothetical protein
MGWRIKLMKIQGIFWVIAKNRGIDLAIERLSDVMIEMGHTAHRISCNLLLRAIGQFWLIPY